MPGGRILRKSQGYLKANPDARSPYPRGQRGPLSDPRRGVRYEGDVTENWDENPRERLERKYPRLPDRGASQPILGIRQYLEDGSPGGVPRWPAPAMRGAEKLPIPRMTARAAGKLSDKLRRQTMIARQARKNQIAVIVPGPGGLAYAKAPRYAGNRPGRQRGLLYNRQGPTLHGVPNQWTRAPKDVVARTELSRVEKIMVRDHGLKLMYDPPEISLSEAVRVTPLVSAALAAGNSELAASYLPAGVTAGYTTGRGSAQNPSWRGSSRILGTGANYIPAPPQTGFNKPSFEEIASGQSDYFGSGRGSLGEATSLTPSIVNWRKTQSDKLKDYFGSGKGSLGEAVYLTPDIVKGNPFLLGKYQPNNFGGGSGGGSGGGGEVFTGGPGVPLSPGLTGGIADGLNAGSAGGSGAGGLGGGSSIGLNFGSLPTVALLALAAFLVLKR